MFFNFLYVSVLEHDILNALYFISCSSYDALSGSPIAVKLIPAVGVVAFAAWGLGPLIRLIRVIFLQVDTAACRLHYLNFLLILQILHFFVVILFRGLIVVGRRVALTTLHHHMSNHCSYGQELH